MLLLPTTWIPVVPAVPARFVLPMNVDSAALIGFVAVPLSLPCTCVPVATVSMYDGSPMALDLSPFTSFPRPMAMDCLPKAFVLRPILIPAKSATSLLLPITIPATAFVALANFPSATLSILLLICANVPIPIPLSDSDILTLLPIPTAVGLFVI